MEDLAALRAALNDFGRVIWADRTGFFGMLVGAWLVALLVWAFTLLP